MWVAEAAGPQLRVQRPHEHVVLRERDRTAGVRLVPDLRPAHVRQAVVANQVLEHSANFAMSGPGVNLAFPRFWKLMSIVAPASCARRTTFTNEA